MVIAETVVKRVATAIVVVFAIAIMIIVGVIVACFVRLLGSIQQINERSHAQLHNATSLCRSVKTRNLKP